MSKNKFKEKQQSHQEEIPKKIRKFSFFNLIDNSFSFSKILKDGVPVELLPKLVFLVILTIVYIANTHYADKVVRKTSKLKVIVEDLRADYTTLKAELMFKSKQSEVAKSIESLGIKESETPPVKLIVTKKDLKLLPK